MATVQGIGAPEGAAAPTLVPEAANPSVAGTRLNFRRHSTALAGTNELDRLYRSLADVTAESHPRTAKLLASSTRKVAQKVFEESGEVALEAMASKCHGIVRESADLLYHLVILWYRAGIHPDQVWSEMCARADEFGIAEKPPKEHHREHACPRQSKSNEA
ncbi:phosphoribosyl-ATP diphosphatase [Bradyrhizobium sp.]|jgi:phosphoribosyl-ATP pyrophosphohydrolase|uniref:phosphoribosyl-ATP diphosphatase n=1 Tax=Bradyrhizobium sp. TaxID=376 RepID=UPI00391D50F3